jgi:hypothetical protein
LEHHCFVEEKIENFWEAVRLMLFIYALAAAVSFAVAGVIKLIFAAIRMQRARAEARSKAGDAAAERTD